ncbi:DUF2637 domain-containing protein [Nocardiopsis composta]|uniref:DUF2637 domain-containing protein n=1 Tax=Nocardiopsis composta TaxID=157465 RepID=A0A7W8QTI8_9ACTN|nr:DUF2637 domain-containing protein [Nocardiopsis composta]MBB5436295.1 hypothetical protein [Nocardiopsis composta]
MDASRWSRRTTIAAVLMLAGIAAVVSYSHMFELAQRHGEPEWRAALFPLSVDGMIVASSTTLLADARRGRRDGLLPWSLLVLGSLASLAANVAVTGPTAWSRVIHAWPSFALMGAYELLMRELRREQSTRIAYADGEHTAPAGPPTAAPENGRERSVAWELRQEHEERGERPRLRVVPATEGTEDKEEETPPGLGAVPRIQAEAWRWAQDNRREDGRLPSGKEIAARFGRKERWGRLIKQWGQQGRFDTAAV